MSYPYIDEEDPIKARDRLHRVLIKKLELEVPKIPKLNLVAALKISLSCMAEHALAEFDLGQVLLALEGKETVI